MSSPEFEFVSKFLTLASLSDPVLTSDYKLPLQQVTKLGVALPALKYKYDPRKVKGSSKNDGKEIPKSITLTLKSIRPPKFSIDEAFPTSSTVYQVKEHLVKEGKAEDVQQLKLLLKGKVLHDSELLSDVVTDQTTITVMISKRETSQVDDSSPSPSPSLVRESIDTQIPWNKIEIILRASFESSEQATQALERLKRGYDMVK